MYKNPDPDTNDREVLSRSQGQSQGQSQNKKVRPFFFNRDGEVINIQGLFAGRSIFMICNGPSLLEHNLELLKQPGVMTYGMNNGPKTFRPNFWSCVDHPQRFLQSIWEDSRILKIVPQKHFERSIFDSEKWKVLDKLVYTCPNVIGIQRNDKFIAKQFLVEDTFNWGNNKKYGGGRSIMLPIFRAIYELGFRKVYMIGCDMVMSETYTYHFDEQREKGAVKGNLDTYDRLVNEYLPQVKPFFDEKGFEVYNCNPHSKLQTFPYMDFEEAVKEATDPLGDVINERTWGMYTKPDDKAKGARKDEPAFEKKNNTASLNVDEARIEREKAFKDAEVHAVNRKAKKDKQAGKENGTPPDPKKDTTDKKRRFFFDPLVSDLKMPIELKWVKTSNDESVDIKQVVIVKRQIERAYRHPDNFDLTRSDDFVTLEKQKEFLRRANLVLEGFDGNIKVGLKKTNVEEVEENTPECYKLLKPLEDIKI